MSKETSAAASKSDDAAKADQDSTYSKDSIRHGRINVQMVQNVLLIWLDNTIDDNNADCCNTIIQLRRMVNDINTFTDSDQCIDYLTDIDQDKACLIISGALCRDIVPLVHDVPQLH